MPDMEQTLTLLPAEALTLPDGAGLLPAEESIADGLSALAAALPGEAAAPTPFDHARRTLAALARADLPQTAAWRGLLALCLLTDVWADGPRIAVRTVIAQSSALAAALLDTGEAIRLVFLGGRLVGTASAEAIVLPAADASDLADILPSRVTWYNRQTGRFADPSALLNEADRLLLLRRLAPMKASAPVSSFIAALNHEGMKPAQAAARQEASALRALAIRVEAVAGLLPEAAFDGLTAETATYRTSSGNPLLSADAQEEAAPAPQTVWLWHGVPFARSSSALGLEAAGAPGESAALDELADEIDLLLRCSPTWRQALHRRLAEWLIGHGSAALSPAARKAIEESKRQAGQFVPDEGVRLSWPLRHTGGAAQLICRECLDDRWQSALAAPFADRLCLLPAGAIDDVMLARTCQLRNAAEPCAVLPPLSAALAQCAAEATDGAALVTEGFAFTLENGAVRASMTLAGKRTLTLTRVYQADEIIRLAAEDVPTLAVWPSVPFAGGRWHAYYAYQHGGGLRTQLLRGGQWISTEDRLFSVVETDHFPAMLLLRQGDFCLGALPNLLPPFEPDRTEPIIAAIDLGASGTAVALRQGLHAEGCALPALVRTLLRGGRSAPMAQEFLPDSPLPAVWPAAAELFSDGSAPLTDGHMLLSSAETIPEKSLIYDLKWGVDVLSRRARRLYLHQLMMSVSLSAALLGAPSISWRVALPEDMTEQGRRGLLEDVAELAPLVAAHTGLPLTAGLAVLHSDASLALGAYHRGEGGIRGGFLSLDWGGTSLSLALWLRGMNRPAVRCALPLGMQALLAELSPDALRADFADLADTAARSCVMRLADQLTATRGSRRALDKARCLLDVCLGTHLSTLTAHMNARYAAGEMTDLQARLAAFAATALAIAGLIQEQTWRDPLLNDYLPANMTLALAGRGSLLFTSLPETLRARLMHLVRLMMSADHPVVGLRFAPSATPKLETALGLTRLTELSETPPGKAVPLRANAPLPLPPDGLIMHFLTMLRMELPEICEKVYPGLFAADGRLTADAAAMIRAAAARHFTSAAVPEAAFAACLAEIRALP